MGPLSPMPLGSEPLHLHPWLASHAKLLAIVRSWHLEQTEPAGPQLEGEVDSGTSLAVEMPLGGADPGPALLRR